MDFAATLIILVVVALLVRAFVGAAGDNGDLLDDLWRTVADDLGLAFVTSRLGALGTQGAAGTIDDYDVAVTRPHPAAFFFTSGDGSGDRIRYAVSWPSSAAPVGMVLRLLPEHGDRVFLAPGHTHAGGLHLAAGNPAEVREWMTPERVVAIESLLADGSGRQRRDRGVKVTDDRLELVLDWSSNRSAEEISMTTRRLVDIAAVLRAGSTATTPSPAIEPITVHPLDEVAAELQDAPGETAAPPMPISLEPEVPEAAMHEVFAASPPAAETPAPPQTTTESLPGDPPVPFPIGEAVAELLDRSLMGHEATARFEEHHRGRAVEWTGTVTATRSFTSDSDFSSPGVRATVLVYRIDDSPLVTNQVQAIVHLPVDTTIGNDQAIRFRGGLHRVDRTMRRFYVADATLLPDSSTAVGAS